MSIGLILIAHASTSAIRKVTFPADEPLDAQGLAKAASLATAVRDADVAWTSPALRAVQTSEALRLRAAVEPALRDIDLGRWSGRSLASVQEDEPDAMAAWMSRSDAAPHGGESIDLLLQRVASWLEHVQKQEGRIVVVTHAAVIRAAIVLCMDAPPASFWRIDIAPLCSVRLQGSRNRWTLQSIGSLSAKPSTNVSPPGEAGRDAAPV